MRQLSSFLPELGYETVLIIESYHKKPGIIRFHRILDDLLQELPFKFVITNYTQSKSSTSSIEPKSKESVNFSLLFKNTRHFANNIEFEEFLMLIRFFFSCNIVRKPRIQQKRAMIIDFDRETTNDDSDGSAVIYPSILCFKDMTSGTGIGPVLKGYFSIRSGRNAD